MDWLAASLERAAQLVESYVGGTMMEKFRPR